MISGEILCFDNTRTLHGRTAYIIKAEGERFLEGAYIEWDNMLKNQIMGQQYKKNQIIILIFFSGEILCFDNVRSLHGHTAYTIKAEAERFLEGVRIQRPPPHREEHL